MRPLPLTIQLFGPLRVLVGGEPMPRVRTRSVEWLLTLLALRSGRAVPRAWLAGMLWMDSDERQALANLRHDLVSLRKALGRERARVQSPTRDTLSLDLEGAAVDVLAFDAAIQAGDEASLRRAVALYTGPLLEGCYAEWVFPERQSRELACLLALETLADAAEQRGDFTDAIALLRRAEGMDTLRDSIQRRLIRVLAARDTPAALMAYREHRLRLRREMNLEPDAETTRLFQQIRAASQGGSPNKDRESCPPEPPPASPPTTDYAAPAPLPNPLTALIGREQAAQEVVRLLAGARLVTLVGTGGIGKTRLSIQAASEAAEDFPNGVVFVALASLQDPALLPAFLAAALGIRGEQTAGAEGLLPALTAWLAAHPLLLVLDNCEHLIEAAATLCQTLLERCPRLHILATSRQRLGLTGEVVWRVPSLPFPAPERLPEEAAPAVEAVLAYPAVRLFVERAGMVRSGFRLTGREEAEAAARICHRLDGIPLAIELAAARAGHLTLSQIAARLDDRFRLLTGGSPGVLTRHQTLRALIDWSYDLLSEPERALLHRLSVFVGGWTLEAAEALFNTEETGTLAPDILELLASLLDKSLVLAEEHPTGLRYRMLETVREYAREKLAESGEEKAARARHADYFLAQAEQARPFVEKTESAWMDKLEAEHDNLQAALTCFAAQEATIEKAVRMAAALALFWVSRGHIYERRTWHLTLALRPTPPTEARARMLVFAGWLVAESENRALAKQLFAESLAIARQVGFPCGAAAALDGLSDLEDDLEASRAYSAASLAITRELGDRPSMARSLYHMGRISRQMGDYDQAHTLLMEAYALDQEMGIKAGFVLRELGDLCVERGDYAAAHRFFGRFVAERHEIGDPWGVVWGLEGMGGLALVKGELERAAELLGAAHTLREAIARPVPPHQRAPYDRLANARQAATDDTACACAWEAGRALTRAEAVRFALSEGAD